MVTIKNLARQRANLTFLKKAANAVLIKEKKSKLDLSIVLVAEKEAKELNKQYRGKDYTPNVLSFPLKELGLGEVVLCPSIIRKEAKEYGIVFKDHLALLLVHGILHLLRYGHKTKKQAGVMELKEQQHLSLVKHL